MSANYNEELETVLDHFLQLADDSDNARYGTISTQTVRQYVASIRNALAQHIAAAVDAALVEAEQAIGDAVFDAMFRSRDFSNGFWHGIADAARVVRELREGRR